MRPIRLFVPLFTTLLLGAPALAITLNLQDRSRTTNCANNLSQLWKMQANYAVQYGGSHKLLPIETGSDFWLKLSSPETNLIDSSLSDIYFCPFSKVTRKSGKCSYRGPRSNVNKSKDGDPVGACIGVHPDGSANVLRKSGDVQTTNKGDSLFRSALEKTKP